MASERKSPLPPVGPLDKIDLESLDLWGKLYKRRGGFGKFAIGNAWQLRFFTLSKKGILTYYDGDPPSGSDLENDNSLELKPRGRVDLISVSYDFYKDVSVEGAPNSFVMQICPKNEEKWVMCATTSDDYQIWCENFEICVADKASSKSRGDSSSNYASDEDDGSKSARTRPATSRGSQPAVSLFSATPDEAMRKKSLSFSGGASTAGIAASGAGRMHRAVTGTHPASSATLTTTPSTPTTTSARRGSSTAAAGTTAVGASVTPPAPTGSKGSPAALRTKKRLKLATKSKNTWFTADGVEWLTTLVIMNFCYYMATQTTLPVAVLYLLFGNAVVAQTLYNRNIRVPESASQSSDGEVGGSANSGRDSSVLDALNGDGGDKSFKSPSPGATAATANGKGGGGGGEVEGCASSSALSLSSAAAIVAAGGKPKAGSTFTESLAPPRNSPSHTWCRVDPRQFQVRARGYDKHKRKDPSLISIYEPFAVDVFCTKQRLDHAATRFQLPDTSKCNMGKTKVPPIFIVQIQIPSEPPPSIFTTVTDGPGWSILLYFKITEESMRQLQDLPTASPSVKLFAQWCEKAPSDPTWSGRFKVINACSNLEELGVPQAIGAYNAKPVLIRRTGSIHIGKNYMEFDIHVHKFATMAKSSIHFLSSRCGLMYMMIGFVIEGRTDEEQPETVFGCVAVNKPQEDCAEFLFEEDP